MEGKFDIRRASNGENGKRMESCGVANGGHGVTVRGCIRELWCSMTLVGGELWNGVGERVPFKEYTNE